MVHLVRNLPPRFNGKPIDTEGFFRLCRQWRGRVGAEVGFWTRRRPKREAELGESSVYFAIRGETVFRLPLVRIERMKEFTERIEPMWSGAWAMVCRPEPTLVEPKRLYRLQGWRYLEQDDTPRDVPQAR